ncbi:MAG: 16S rRNA (guanine(966)-N(2))-methyltransferase RsmD [Candidatus Aerophobetes bacterium]|nr:16S rRNA (guanine(966)-N(2))-methyltransferase RsmD [Candidatus Aerophobetes bacterium]
MRITGGRAGGKKINSPRNSFTRALLSRIRKSLFDILGEKIKESRFLDLYAGSGAVGIEALSRGAKRVVFVEKSAACVRIIKENLFLCGFYSFSTIWQKDVLSFLPLLLEEEEFDFIFVAPPYYKNLQNRTLDILEEKDLIKTEVIVQYSPREKLNFSRKNIKVKREKRYGDTILAFLSDKKQRW